MTLPSMRPLSFGEILDGAFTLYRRNFLRFICTSLLVMGGALACIFLLALFGAFAASAVGGGLAVGVVLVIGTAAMALATLPYSTLAWQAARSYQGKPAPLGDSLEAGGGAAMTLLGSGIIAAAAMYGTVYVLGLAVEPLMAMAGSPALVVVAGALMVLVTIGAILFIAALFFGVLPAVLMEEKGPVDAVVRSVRLARGDLPRIAATLLVTLLIVTLPALATSVLSGGMLMLNGNEVTTAVLVALVLDQLLSLVVAVLTMPFLPSVLVLLYYDRRVRTEALDVRIATDGLKLAGA